MQEIRFGSKLLSDYREASSREWLEANGLGGWASSTISGAHTRRYHGLLVAAERPPLGRMVLLSRLDETIVVDGQRYELASREYPNAVNPCGSNFLVSFSKDYFPVFEYAAGGVLLRKVIACPHGANTTVITYEVLDAPGSFDLELQPFVACRDYHSLQKKNDFVRPEAKLKGDVLLLEPYEGCPSIYIKAPGASFESAPDWYYNFFYSADEQRGFDALEDLFTHGRLRLKARPGLKIGIIISTKNPEKLSAQELLKSEQARRQKLTAQSGVKGVLGAQLTLAADQFIVRRGEADETILAGYHWFSDWGRDTMISLPGLCLATGRFEDAKKILLAFSHFVSDGMLPNRFPDEGSEPEYNTFDATLWLFVAVYKYLLYTGDQEFVRSKMMPTLGRIIEWHIRGTRFEIKVDDDGLLRGGTPMTQITWMDARVGGWPVTARPGKPVEINALWYNALCIMRDFHRVFGDEERWAHFGFMAEQTRKSFEELFWKEDSGWLYDYVDGSVKEAAVRPNQIFAVSLPYPILTGEKAKSVVGIVKDRLFTPHGLRSLEEGHPSYSGLYSGAPSQRDRVYHQGTVWSWLIGPYLSALVRVNGEAGKAEAREIISQLSSELLRAGVGTISEIFDGGLPHLPRGAVSQAWSVGEVLRVLAEDLGSLNLKLPFPAAKSHLSPTAFPG